MSLVRRPASRCSDASSPRAGRGGSNVSCAILVGVGYAWLVSGFAPSREGTDMTLTAPLDALLLTVSGRATLLI